MPSSIGDEQMNGDHTRIDLITDPLKKRMVGRTLHGGVDFDVPYMTQIADNLWQGGCEQGLVLPSHINYLVSLYPWERYQINHKMRAELYVRMYDDPAQSLEQIDDIALQVHKWRQKGQVLVHCQAGLNRSSVVVVRALMFAGMGVDEAINLVREKRSPACLCNAGFENWLRSMR